MRSVRAIAGVGVVCSAFLAAGCSGGSSPSVAGTNTSIAQVSALRAGASLPVNGLLTTLSFRHTCIRDAASTICAALVPPGVSTAGGFLPALNLGEPVNGVVVRGKYPGHANALTWSFVTNS